MGGDSLVSRSCILLFTLNRGTVIETHPGDHTAEKSCSYTDVACLRALAFSQRSTYMPIFAPITKNRWLGDKIKKVFFVFNKYGDEINN